MLILICNNKYLRLFLIIVHKFNEKRFHENKIQRSRFFK